MHSKRHPVRGAISKSKIWWNKNRLSPNVASSENVASKCAVRDKCGGASEMMEMWGQTMRRRNVASDTNVAAVRNVASKCGGKHALYQTVFQEMCLQNRYSVAGTKVLHKMPFWFKRYILKSCHFDGTCWQKNGWEFGSILHLPRCYVWRGCSKNMFFPVLCNNCWKKKCNVWVMVAMLLTHVGKKLARVWFHTSPATLLLFEGDVEKTCFFSCWNDTNCNASVISVLFLKVAILMANVGKKNGWEFGSILHLPLCYFWRGCSKKTCFSQCFATTAERKKCNFWVISVFYLKSCHVADTCWKKGENLVLYCACHTTTFEEDVEKIMFFLTVLQQLLKRIATLRS